MRAKTSNGIDHQYHQLLKTNKRTPSPLRSSVQGTCLQLITSTTHAPQVLSNLTFPGSQGHGDNLPRDKDKHEHSVADCFPQI